MFWGERGEELGRIGKNEWKWKEEKYEQERSYRRLVFFCCCYEFGGCFLEGGVEMS